METIDYTIGDEIVSLVDDVTSVKAFKENEVFIAKELITGCKHFPILVNIGIKTIDKNCGCFKCNVVFSNVIQYAIANNFRKLDTLVNISELTEILEKPAFS